MAYSLKIISGSNGVFVNPPSSFPFTDSKPKVLSARKSRVPSDRSSSRDLCVRAQASICVSGGRRWWDKSLKANMLEMSCAQELVDSLENASDRLVVVDFYSPGCGGCRALHPKICELAESNPDAIFLKVNYEQLRSMCNSLNVHVLPFFRMYRGAQGHVCSFSCTNATIKKFKDALAKYGKDRCSLGPAKGLNEEELLRLAANGELTSQLCSQQVLPVTGGLWGKVGDDRAVLMVRESQLWQAKAPLMEDKGKKKKTPIILLKF